MSKKRKTKKEKISTETRKLNVSQIKASTLPTYSFSSSSAEIQKTSNFLPQRTIHAYVATDIKHTLLITSILFVSSIIFYVLIQSHVVHLSNFGY